MSENKKSYYIMVTPEVYNEATGNELRYPMFADNQLDQYVDLPDATEFDDLDVALSQVCEPWEIVVSVDIGGYAGIKNLEDWSDYINFDPIIPEYAYVD